ncbi:MAG TPA: OsmC family peroxiredoxin [Bacteroidia bacterium]|jgi:osmotically inducible protein OsmC|nr:OsmC family peroxiredoxin [Bacteroidia bacterium]
MKRNATAVWLGTGKEGNGKLSTGSKLLSNAQYSYKSRFEDGVGTNPEELIAAAHAGCFSMKLAFVLGAAGFTPESIETFCENQLANGVIEFSHLVCKAKVAGISPDAFQKAAEEAKATCPVSKSLNMPITLEATLV